MKISNRILLIFLLLNIFFISWGQQTYTLLPKKSGKLNKKVIDGLSPSLKAMAALYSAMGGTDCMEQQCALTSALGLGKQGSDAQKSLIMKYFPGDKAAKQVISQDCYLPPSSASSFSNFQWLAFQVSGDTIRVNYELDVLNQGNIKKIKGPDVYLYKNQVFKNIKRVLYAWIH